MPYSKLDCWVWRLSARPLSNPRFAWLTRRRPIGGSPLTGRLLRSRPRSLTARYASALTGPSPPFSAPMLHAKTPSANAEGVFAWRSATGNNFSKKELTFRLIFFFLKFGNESLSLALLLVFVLSLLVDLKSPSATLVMYNDMVTAQVRAERNSAFSLRQGYTVRLVKSSILLRAN